MTWQTHYLAPDPTKWKGRADTPPGSCFFQNVELVNLLETRPAQATRPTFAFIGFKCDEGVRRNHGRPGAVEGPSALRQALARLPILKETAACLDVGDIVCTDGDLESSQEALGDVAALLLQKGINTIVLGGGHELAWGHFQGIAQTFIQQDVGIINFDAHFDMRPVLEGGEGTSGSPFLQIAKAHQALNRRLDYNCIGVQHAGNVRQTYETAKKYNSHIIWADELHLGQLEKAVDFIDRIIDQNEIIYLSICLDVFSAAFAPGVSATQALGLYPWHAIPLIRQIAACGKVICFDIAELAPRYDFDHHTAKLAANLVYEFIHHYNEQPRHW